MDRHTHIFISGFSAGLQPSNWMFAQLLGVGMAGMGTTETTWVSRRPITCSFTMTAWTKHTQTLSAERTPTRVIKTSMKKIRWTFCGQLESCPKLNFSQWIILRLSSYCRSSVSEVALHCFFMLWWGIVLSRLVIAHGKHPPMTERAINKVRKINIDSSATAVIRRYLRKKSFFTKFLAQSTEK